MDSCESARTHPRATDPVRVATVAAVLTLLAAAPWLLPADLSRGTLAARLDEAGLGAAALSVALMVLHSFVPFPAELLAFANGMVFGPVAGTLITWIGGMAGALSAFGFARGVGRPLLADRLAGRTARFDHWCRERGWPFLVGVRLVPVIAFNLVNFAAGVTALRWRTFAWTTAVGILPMCAAMSVAGHGARLLAHPGMVAGVLAACALGAWLLARGRSRARRAQPAAPLRSRSSRPANVSASTGGLKR